MAHPVGSTVSRGRCGNCNNPTEQALFLNPMGPCEPPVCGDCHKELAAYQRERKR